MKMTMRDITYKQLRTALERYGWTKPDFSFLGYWQHTSGLHASLWNYRTNRAALAGMIALGEKHVKFKAEEARREAAKDAD